MGGICTICTLLEIFFDKTMNKSIGNRPVRQRPTIKPTFAHAAYRQSDLFENRKLGIGVFQTPARININVKGISHVA